MTHKEFVRAEIAAMCGNRRNLSAAHRDILRQLLNTPAILRRFAPLTGEEIWAVAEEWLGNVADAKRKTSRRFAVKT